MKTYVFCLLLICVPLLLLAQQDIALPGVVVEQNSAYRTGEVKYLSNASVSAAGAGATTSDAAGRFRLVFADKPYGNVARLYVRKQDYEVVNTRVIEHATVLGRTAPLKVVMCPAGQLYENQVRYYAIARDEAIKNYERRVAMLEKGGAEMEQLLRELRLQYDQEVAGYADALALLQVEKEKVEQQARELADKWVTINLDDQSHTYQRAFRAFEAGDIDLAIQIMDSVNLEERLQINKEQREKEEGLIDTLNASIAQRNEQTEQDVQACLLAARLCKVKYDWQGVENYYQIALKFDNQNPSVVLEVASFYYEQNDFNKAIAFYEQGLNYVQDSIKRATFLNNMAVLFYSQKNFQVADTLYKAALGIRKGLAVNDPGNTLPDLAATINNIGLLEKAQKNYSAAEELLLESLKIFNELENKHPTAYLTDIAKTLGNLGDLKYKEHDYQLAEHYFQGALLIRRNLVAEQPETYLPGLADVLNNIGILHRAQHKYLLAETSYKEAISIYKRFAALQPHTYLPSVAKTLTNLGDLQRIQNEFEAATNSYEESLKIHRELAFEQPEAFQYRLSATLHNVGLLYLAQGKIENAINSFQESIDIKRSLTARQPKAFGLELVITLHSLGSLYYELIKSKWDNHLILQGSVLMEEAIQALSVYPLDNPNVKMLKPAILWLAQFFENRKGGSPILIQQVQLLDSLKEEIVKESDYVQMAVLQELLIAKMNFLATEYPNEFKVTNRMASEYSSLSWYYLFSSQFKEAEEAARNGLRLGPSEDWINAFLVLAILYQGRWNEAKAIYQQYMHLPHLQETLREAFLEDLDALEGEGITHPDVAKARALLSE